MTVAEKVITSPDNAVFRQLRDCLETRGIRKHGLFLVFGERAIRESFTAHPSLIHDLVHREKDAAHSLVQSTKELAGSSPSRVTVISISAALFDELDIFGTKTPILVLRAPEIESADLNQEPVALEVLCALSDPSNVGALLRTAAAFAASRVILLKESASPFHPKAVRAASGTTLLTPLARGPSIRELGDFENIVALDLEGQPLADFQWPKNTRLLIGEEGLGIPQLDNINSIMIPMAKSVESLNASVSAGIAMYDYRRSFGTGPHG